MITLDTILPKLKRNERIVSSYENEQGYVRFTIEFRHWKYKISQYNVFVTVDKQSVSISYYYADTDSWAFEYLQAFLARLSDTLKKHELIRLRLVTGAVKFYIEGKLDKELHEHEQEMDSHEAIAFFVSAAFGLGAIFELLGAFEWKTIGFFIGTLAAFGYFAYTSFRTWFSENETLRDNTTWLFSGVSVLMILVLTSAVAVTLAVGIMISWLLPWVITVAVFLLTQFAYRPVALFVRKLKEMNHKYSAGA